VLVAAKRDEAESFNRQMKNAWLPPYPIAGIAQKSFIAIVCHPLVVNLAVFFVLSFVIFRRNSEFLFYGSDGRFEVTLIEQFRHFAPPVIGLTSDALRGLGNVTFPVNPYWVPGYILPILLSGHFSNFVLCYTICVSEIFIATYFTCRLIQLPPLAGIAGAWLAPLVIMPYFGFGLIPTTAAAFPHYATVLAVSSLTAACCLVVGVPARAAAIAAGIGLFLGVGYVVVIAPTLLVLSTPLIAIFCVLTLIAPQSREERIAKLLTFGLAGVVSIAAFGPFVAGLFLDTTASFFQRISQRPATLQEISMLFWTPYPFLNPKTVFVGGGLAGAFVVACLAPGRARLAALGVLFSEACLFAIGGLQFVHPFWFGPALWYFEGFLFCFFAIFLAAGIFAVGRMLVLLVGPLLARWRLPVITTIGAPLAGTAIAAIAVVYVLYRGTSGTAGPLYIPYPQGESAITKILKDEISLGSDRQFRGRVGEFIGRALPSNNNYEVWNYLRHVALVETGNTHGGAGLWQDAIPTLSEYSPQMTPAYFAFTRRFFTLPGDIQSRNWVQMRNIDARLLAMVGVRFVLTDAPASGAMSLRSEIPLQVSETRRAELYAPKEFENLNFGLYLYEIPGANLGQYSPTVLVRAGYAAEILQVLESSDFQPSRSIVSGEALPANLRPASLQEFTIGRGDYRIRATSLGPSVLLLPIEFSHCLTISGQAANARLFRANLVLTGLLFERNIDARIAYRNGPFSNPACRLSDRTEFNKLEMSDVFHDHPEFRP
jgi:hypothetical protein